MSQHGGSSDDKIETGLWLITYADMMNNLLVLFMVLYAMSVMDLKKFQDLASQLNTTFNKPQVVASAGAGTGAGTSADAFSSIGSISSGEPSTEKTIDFDFIYETIKTEISKQGYDGMIIAEKGEDYIKFRFNDNVLFYPDSSSMKQESYKIITDMGNILMLVNEQIKSIEIGGHTATVSGGNSSTLFAWQLSSDRAIAVLDFLAGKCGLPQSKMSISGYSHYQPVSSNDSEESRALNRRVEIKITRILKN